MQRPVSREHDGADDPEEKRRRAVREDGGQSDPRSRREKRWFFFTSFAAGLCEEIIFRGFFLYLLGRAFPAAPWFLLAAAAGFMFGVAHFYQGSRACSRLRCWGPCLVCCIWGQTRSCCVCRFIFCSIFLRLSSMKVETNKQGRRAMLHGGRSSQDVQVVQGPAGRQRRLMCLLPQLRCSRMAFWTHQSPYRARATALRASTTFK